MCSEKKAIWCLQSLTTGSPPLTPLIEEAYSAPQTPYLVGIGIAAPPQELSPPLSAFKASGLGPSELACPRLNLQTSELKS